MNDLPHRIGSYIVGEVLGEGGMGTVYLAEQREPIRRTVALKVLKTSSDSERVLARYEIERQALAVMDHPSIAKVFDAGITDDGSPYVVMERVDGTPIGRYCDERRLTIRKRVRLFAEVCRAIQHAHQKGVIHRDLKPAHVLVSDVDGRPLPRIIDFGIAMALEPEERPEVPPGEPLEVAGTPGYMSPEQIEGSADIDTRTDGGFKRSSQHLKKEEELRWRQASADGRIELYVRRCVHPVVPRWDAGSIGRGSGRKSLEGCRARSRRWQPACLPLLARAGFANVVACHLSVFVLCRGATYRSSSEKRLRFFMLAVAACARSPGSWAAHRRRSRENCGGTQQHEVETSSIEPQPPNGMPIDERDVRKLPNSLQTAN